MSRGARLGRTCGCSASRERRGPPRAARAFTYFEVLIVVGMIAVLGATAILRFGSYAQHRRLEMATARVLADLARAQQVARYRATEITVDFRPALESYAIPALTNLNRSTSFYYVKLSADPYGVELRSADFKGGGTLTFNGYGLPLSGGEVILGLGADEVRIAVDADTGRAQVE